MSAENVGALTHIPTDASMLRRFSVERNHNRPLKNKSRLRVRRAARLTKLRPLLPHRSLQLGEVPEGDGSHRSTRILLQTGQTPPTLTPPKLTPPTLTPPTLTPPTLTQHSKALFGAVVRRLSSSVRYFLQNIFERFFFLLSKNK